ncbi:STN domain-containing protein [Acetobacter sp. TBRC 12305]|uniref:STN domain-containing protein n=1 Tax=Acetobacter garciniae TaxID=2817435 RepID=A0A939HMG1_9PROT|nr:STN domain-containing protein [Acetobacter garciniae]MBO1324801.1 STN domain-containing protein [Acetobacter garciniae]MBX0344492.1 STN domain-containing protein [Acetobacter garciniae]
MSFSTKTVRLSAVATVLALPLVGCASPECQSKHYEWDAPRRPLSAAVENIRQRTGCTVTVDPDLLTGKTSAEIHGNYRPLQATRHVLRGSGLKVGRTEGGLIIVARHPQKSGTAASHEDED